jgi:hypothetical protein
MIERIAADEIMVDEITADEITADETREGIIDDRPLHTNLIPPEALALEVVVVVGGLRLGTTATVTNDQIYLGIYRLIKVVQVVRTQEGMTINNSEEEDTLMDLLGVRVEVKEGIKEDKEEEEEGTADKVVLEVVGATNPEADSAAP